ncbi:MAG TPA: hypothetical protein VHT52_08875 [Stellaceae bacterium]|jgi:hypothetical protein|nr:hypothetical protein [Stellaceae bacterium]
MQWPVLMAQRQCTECDPLYDALCTAALDVVANTEYVLALARANPKGVARFPFPPHGRIPNFVGAEQAAARLLDIEP